MKIQLAISLISHILNLMEKTKVIPLLVRFTPEQVKAVEKIWHQSEFKTRSETIRYLLNTGITTVWARGSAKAGGK